MTLYPTHTCFDDAAEFLLGRANELRLEKTSNRLKLVHGILRAPDGILLSHAWVEEDGEVAWDHGKLHPSCQEKVIVRYSNREDYYSKLAILECTRYSIEDAYSENKKYGTFGPWLDKYKVLCRDNKPVSTTHGLARI